MIGIILTLQWGHDYQRTSTVFSADHSDHSYDSLRSGPAHTWIFLGVNLDVKNYAGANKLFDNCHVMPDPAQMNSVGIIDHTTKWHREVVNRVKLCTISQSSSWPSREAEFPSLSRSPPPPGLDNWQLTSSTTLRSHHVWKCSTFHFLFLEGMSVWLSTNSNNCLWQVSK